MEGQHPLKTWRLANSLRQEDAAKRLGTSKPTISRIETGARKPSLSLATKLSRGTKIPVEEFESWAAA
jgi:transcriptional regulator with XRE-family HTH domain